MRATSSFDGKRVELIDGLIVTMSPKSPSRGNVVMWLNRWLMNHVDQSRFDVGVGASLQIGASEPDLEPLPFGELLASAS